MNLANHLQDLLYRYECVILPGFGAFLTQRKSAFFNENSQSFYPPKKVVSFNRQLTNNDGLLANYISEVENISYKAAVIRITDFVNDLEKSLENESQVELGRIGRFYLSIEGLIQFQPLDSTNYLAEAFGLSQFPVQEIKREKYKKQVAELTAKKEIHVTPNQKWPYAYLKYAAIGLLALGVSGFAGLSIYSNQISQHNIAQQQAAESQLQQQIQQATFIIDSPLASVTLKVDKQSGDYHVVAGAFRVEENAQKKVKELKLTGHKARLIGANRFGLHQVVYSSHQTRKEALQMLRKVKQENEGAWLLIEEL